MKVAFIVVAVCIGILYGKSKTREIPEQDIQLAAMAIGKWLCMLSDVDGNGILDEKQALIDSTDEDGDGISTRDEFARSWSKKNEKLHDNWSLTVFDWVDTNDDGLLTMEDEFLDRHHDPVTGVFLLKDCIMLCTNHFLQDIKKLKEEITEQENKGVLQLSGNV
ncbi:uncharacterized protein LOC106169152 [Lingula anatina]|uniref:Uncharacterized protein LOC106169152 n=1 Tax=Lingula anatina TaxID=7574 RepID=A0A1S3J137_LINAN|nr:uncharacterized protein LOC106169152 [Lingula anatina]|eukprot:XP_013403971.1 uncharacterized protein LOC106169152 [Lingula anatina]